MSRWQVSHLLLLADLRSLRVRWADDLHTALVHLVIEDGIERTGSDVLDTTLRFDCEIEPKALLLVPVKHCAYDVHLPASLFVACDDAEGSDDCQSQTNKQPSVGHH